MMTIKFLHLNIFFGYFLENVISYIKQEKFDVLHFQEITGGKLMPNLIDGFEIIKRRLGYDGELVKNYNFIGDKKSYYGNATFFKKEFNLLKKDIIYLKEYKEVDEYKERKVEDDPHSVLSLILEKRNKKLQVINTHLAWGKTQKDEPYKVSQGRKLYNYVKNVKEPFVLSGDFNVTADSEIVAMLNNLGRNLTVENKVTNTLNFNFHKSPHLFPPGLAVDFIYTSKDINVKQFKVIDDIALSDHYGLYLEIEI